MTPPKLISNEYRCVSLTLYEQSDELFAQSLEIVTEANERLGLGDDPLELLIRQEESDLF